MISRENGEGRRLKTEQYKNELEIRKRKVSLLKKQIQEKGEFLSTEEQESLRIDLEIAEQELEFYVWERDTTGAKKGQRFGVELGELLDQMGLKRNETGELIVDDPENLHKNHLILVNMGELDRLNSKGDHKLGDMGLSLVYNKIQQEFLSNLSVFFQEEGFDEENISQMFEIYRISGNDFVVIVKGIDEKIVEKITKNLNGLMEVPVDQKKDQVPLTSHSITFNGSFELLKELTNFETSIDQTFDEVEQANNERKLLITLLRERILVLGEFAKIKTRLDRMVDVINNPNDLRPDELYEKYLKKSLGLLFVRSDRLEAMDYSEFVEALQERGAGVLGGEYNKLKWDREKFIVARDEAIRIFQNSHEMNVKMEIDLQDKLIKELHERGIKEELIFDDEKHDDIHVESKRMELTQERLGGIDEFNQRLDGLGETRGELLMLALKKDFDVMKDSEEHGLDEKLKKEKIRLAELKLEVAKLKYDTLTGLKNRGMLFQEIEARLDDKKPVSVVSIDMAFLKYFNIEGGKKTGDMAIKSAGRILDNIAREYQKYGVQAYRIGGDEFALTINLDDKQIIMEIIQKIKTLSSQYLESIPAHEGAGLRYKRESLHFNFGISMYGNDSDFQMIDADKLINMADALIEGDKTVDRFILLLHREVLKERDANKEMADLEVLYEYSYKTIFGIEGRKLIEELTQEYNSKSVSLSEIERQMIEFITMKLKDKGKKKLEKQELEHIFLRNELVKEMQELEIRRLTEDLRKAKLESERDERMISSLKKRLEEAQNNLERIVRVRENL